VNKEDLYNYITNISAFALLFIYSVPHGLTGHLPFTLQEGVFGRMKRMCY